MWFWSLLHIHMTYIQMCTINNIDKENENEKDGSDQNNMNILLMWLMWIIMANMETIMIWQILISILCMIWITIIYNNINKQGCDGGDTLDTRLNQWLKKYKTIDRSSASGILSTIDETHIFIKQSSNNLQTMSLIQVFMMY